MKKVIGIFAMMMGAAIAALVIWDRMPPEKKRNYIDATEPYQKWYHNKWIWDRAGLLG